MQQLGGANELFTIEFNKPVVSKRCTRDTGKRVETLSSCNRDIRYLLDIIVTTSQNKHTLSHKPAE